MLCFRFNSRTYPLGSDPERDRVICEVYTNPHGSGLPVPEKSALYANLIAPRAFSHAGNKEYTRMHRVRGLIICDTRGLR